MSKPMEIHSPFICCGTCGERIPLRIDSFPTWHYKGNLVCEASLPHRLMSHGHLRGGR